MQLSQRDEIAVADGGLSLLGDGSIAFWPTLKRRLCPKREQRVSGKPLRDIWGICKCLFDVCLARRSSRQYNVQ